MQDLICEGNNFTLTLKYHVISLDKWKVISSIEIILGGTINLPFAAAYFTKLGMQL